MSRKEITRRKMCRFVFKQMWRFTRKNGWKLNKSSTLKIAWLLIKGQMRLRHSKIRGVSHDSRQKSLCRMFHSKKDQYALFIVREYNNLFDPNAISIYVEFDTGEVEQIGYISKNLSAAYSTVIDAGRKLLILDTEIVGNGKKYFGLNFEYVLV